MGKTRFVERKGKLSELDHTFDLKFWQTQTPEMRFNAAWEQLVHYANVKGIDVRLRDCLKTPFL